MTVLYTIPVNAYSALEINYHAKFHEMSITVQNNQPERTHYDRSHNAS